MKQFVRKIARRIVGANSMPMPNDRLRVLGEALEYVSTMARFEDVGQQDSLRGDYLEFGVWQGKTFAQAFHYGTRHNDYMRYIACDSFEGLPVPKGLDAGAEFQQGQFACSHKQFLSNIQVSGVDIQKVITVEGWFDKSLTKEVVSEHQISVAAVSYIDCDLYESCVPVLDFLTPLVQQGSILMFDDWFCFRAAKDKGVQLATAEWLTRNPHISLIDWKCFGPYGKAFFVDRDGSIV